MIRAREGSSGFSSAAFAPRALALAGVVTVTFYAVAGLAEATLIRVLQPSELELDWISDAVLSSALGIAVYLWLHLRATRLALTEQERSQLIIQSQLSMADAMQRRLLPPIPRPLDGFEWAAQLMPAGKIGGDFFDFLDPVPGVRLTLIADISGKGISAAMALTLLRFTFRPRHPEPGRSHHPTVVRPLWRVARRTLRDLPDHSRRSRATHADLYERRPSTGYARTQWWCRP